MIAGIEIGKEYVQVCVKTESMREPESVTKIAGTEHYRIPTEANLEDKNELQSLFRRMWKMIAPYGNKETLECLMFCLEDNSEDMRENLLEITQIYDIPSEKVHFLDKPESFCAYVLHQRAELLTHNALLIENHEMVKEYLLLHKKARTMPVVTEVRKIEGEALENIFTNHAISSVFLVGDDFEEEWMQKNKKLLKNGRRIFVGKNLYVKGAVYRGMDLLEKQEPYLYLGENKVCCNIALLVESRGEEQTVVISEGGKNWYESSVSLEVLLAGEPKLEFSVIPINGVEKKTVLIGLENLPKRPNYTTRLFVELEFTSPSAAKVIIKDLGFGELFPQSDAVYEGELKWEQ